MIAQNEKESLIQFASKIGLTVEKNEIQNIEVKLQKTFDFLPELALSFASYIVKKTFIRQTTPPKFIKDSICFFFFNMFDDGGQTNRNNKTQEKPTHVRVFPSALIHKSAFKKNTHVKAVFIIISADYLKTFLKNDSARFQFLFDRDNNFFIEEIMTDDILRTVKDIVKKEQPNALNSYYYKLKAMELLFYLFQSLSKREKSTNQKINEKEIQAIYKVRDRIASSLDKPSSILELKTIAGMNELKMRKLFMQIFGIGIYDYYQHLRMKEAARLLREEKLAVSEVGYQMGFENLSHFTRVFEKNIGKKPKKYSKDLLSEIQPNDH